MRRGGCSPSRAAWFARREHGVWSMSTQRGLDAAPRALTLRDEDIPGVAALLSGETIAYDRVERASPRRERDRARARRARRARRADHRRRDVHRHAGRGPRGGDALHRAGPRAGGDSRRAGRRAAARAARGDAHARRARRARRVGPLLREQLRRKEQIVETLQQIYIPRAFPTVPGISFDAVYVPAEDDARVGGDWYDVFRLPDGRLAFSVGDVAGHGLHAAVTMGAIRQAIYVASLDSPDPAVVLRASTACCCCSTRAWRRRSSAFSTRARARSRTRRPVIRRRWSPGAAARAFSNPAASRSASSTTR